MAASVRNVRRVQVHARVGRAASRSSAAPGADDQLISAADHAENVRERTSLPDSEATNVGTFNSVESGGAGSDDYRCPPAAIPKRSRVRPLTNNPSMHIGTLLGTPVTGSHRCVKLAGNAALSSDRSRLSTASAISAASMSTATSVTSASLVTQKTSFEDFLGQFPSHGSSKNDSTGSTRSQPLHHHPSSDEGRVAVVSASATRTPPAAQKIKKSAVGSNGNSAAPPLHTKRPSSSSSATNVFDHNSDAYDYNGDDDGGDVAVVLDEEHPVRVSARPRQHSADGDDEAAAAAAAADFFESRNVSERARLERGYNVIRRRAGSGSFDSESSAGRRSAAAVMAMLGSDGVAATDWASTLASSATSCGSSISSYPSFGAGVAGGGEEFCMALPDEFSSSGSGCVVKAIDAESSLDVAAAAEETGGKLKQLCAELDDGPRKRKTSVAAPGIHENDHGGVVAEEWKAPDRDTRSLTATPSSVRNSSERRDSPSGDTRTKNEDAVVAHANNSMHLLFGESGSAGRASKGRGRRSRIAAVAVPPAMDEESRLRPPSCSSAGVFSSDYAARQQVASAQSAGGGAAGESQKPPRRKPVSRPPPSW